MAKLQRKISGGRRSDTGAEAFLDVRSDLEAVRNTARAQGPCSTTCSPANDGSAVGASP